MSIAAYLNKYTFFYNHNHSKILNLNKILIFRTCPSLLKLSSRRAYDNYWISVTMHHFCILTANWSFCFERTNFDAPRHDRVVRGWDFVLMTAQCVALKRSIFFFIPLMDDPWVWDWKRVLILKTGMQYRNERWVKNLINVENLHLLNQFAKHMHDN